MQESQNLKHEFTELRSMLEALEHSKEEHIRIKLEYNIEKKIDAMISSLGTIESYSLNLIKEMKKHVGHISNYINLLSEKKKKEGLLIHNLESWEIY
jgi:hypothetical protein